MRKKIFLICFLFLTIVGCSDSGLGDKYNGQIIHQPSAQRGIEDGFFLVKDGKKIYIGTMDWIYAHGFKETDFVLLPHDEFDKIPKSTEGLPE